MVLNYIPTPWIWVHSRSFWRDMFSSPVELEMNGNNHQKRGRPIKNQSESSAKGVDGSILELLVVVQVSIEAVQVKSIKLIQNDKIRFDLLDDE